MTPGGWFVMLVSVGFVVILFGWCIYKVLTPPDKSGRMHGFEVDTGDNE